MTQFIKISPEDMGSESDIRAVVINPAYVVSMTQFREGTGINLVNSHIATRMPLNDILAQVGVETVPNQPREAADEIPPAILQSWLPDEDDEDNE